MSKRINVILLEDIESVGQAGEIVAVVEGYARNFLFSQGKAALATEGMVKQHAQQQAKTKAAHSAQLEKLQEQAAALDGTELVMTARVKDGEEIFGSITRAMLAKQLHAQAKITVTAKDIVLAKPITTLGGQDVVIKLSPEVETTVRVTVVAEAGSTPKLEEE